MDCVTSICESELSKWILFSPSTAYNVVDLDFDHSAATLPIPGKPISHAEYFAKKGVKLNYPKACPIVVAVDRKDRKLFFPAELVMGDELDDRVKRQLPKIASFMPDRRNRAINKIKDYLTPGAKGLLPAIGVVLKAERIVAKASVLPVPSLVAAGIPIPDRSAEFWTPVLSKANFDIDTKQAVEMKVILFFHKQLKPEKVYDRIRDMVNGFKTFYRFGAKPFAMVKVGDNDQHYGEIEKFFSSKVASNVFVLDFAKPRGSLDPAYPVVKYILTKSGYLSQFVNFKTFAHDAPGRDAKRSDIILNGVSRQILQKAGVCTFCVYDVFNVSD